MDLMHTALICEISIDDYFENTYQENLWLIDAYKERQRVVMQNQALIAYTHADLIGSSVARIMSDDATMPSFKEAFSYLFEEEKLEDLHRDTSQEELKFQANILEFAKAHNKKWKNQKGGKN